MRADLQAMIEAGEKYSDKSPIPPEYQDQIPPEEPEKPKELTDNQKQLAMFFEIAEISNPKINFSKDKNYEKLDDAGKIKLCSRTSGMYAMIKMVDGRVKYTPRNCNLCPTCYEANTEKLKDKVNTFMDIAENSDKTGSWRKKVVDEGTEAQSLKKRIKRNQDDTRFEMSCDMPDKSEVWTYVDDEPGKDMDEIYGEKANPDDIDFKELYERNRSTGKKLTTGSGLKNKPVVAEKKDTERLIIPEILIKNLEDKELAAKIIEETNYIELAINASHARRLYIYQFKFVLQELKAANIEIAAIKLNYFNMASDELLEEWNSKTQWWMSIDASTSKNVDPQMDMTTHLVFPTVYIKPDNPADKLA